MAYHHNIMSSTNTTTILKLKSSDNKIFEVEEAVAVQSETIKYLVEVGCAEHVIPLPNVDSKTLVMVIEWCKKHADQSVKGEELKEWDASFVDVDQAVLYDLTRAANYLCVKDLLEQTCQKVAAMIKGKQPEEIRETFNIKNEFTPEEDAEVRKENSWAFEK